MRIKGLLKRLPNILFIFVIVAVLTAGLIRTLFFPREINGYENRYAEKIKKPTLAAIGDHSFQDSIENALSDQIIGAMTMKKKYNDLTSSYLNALVAPILNISSDRYVSFMGLNIFGGDHIVYDYRDLDSLKPSMDRKAENYNAVFEKYPDIDFYAYFIEKDTEINFETGEKSGSAEYALSKLALPEENKGIYSIDSFAQFSESFYKTDHHWNHKGAYRAYCELLKLLGTDEAPLAAGDEKTVYDAFSGSKTATAGAGVFKETFSAYGFEYPAMDIRINGSPAQSYGSEIAFFESGESSAVTYGSFYGADNGEIVFDSHRPERENILLIGESYDNAVLKLLASHYNVTYSIDLRNYEHYFGERFDFDRYVSTRDIDCVLFIGNVDFFTMEEFLLED